MGVVILGAIALYFFVTIVVVLLVARAARKRGRSPWRWGGGAALAMYLLLFWDHIPTLIAHKYYCEREAGFWVHKTLKQWKAENPGIAGTLSETRKPQTTGKDGQFRFWTSQRFYTDRKQTRHMHTILREDEYLFDATTSGLLAHSTNFVRGRSGTVFAMGGSLDDYRQALIFGWGNRGCGPESPAERMRVFRYEFQKLGAGK